MKINKNIFFSYFLTMLLLLSGCQSRSMTITKGNGTRDNTPVVLKPVASGQKTIGNKKIIFDISHTTDGYIMVKYMGDNPKVKVKIKNPNEKDPYIYDIFDGYNVFPLTGGNGKYTLIAYENISGTKYSQLYSQTIQITIDNELSPYLYPNQYVNFNQSTKLVTMGEEIAESADNDLDVVTYVYDYVVRTLTYDNQKAEEAKNGNLAGYLPNVDEIIDKKTGICFDYAAVMATILRSQNIPTRMMIGYVSMPEGSVYHAWISVYLKDIGWVDGLIQFDGKNWSMMDPTLISDGNNSSSIRDFVKDKNNYTTKYLY